MCIYLYSFENLLPYPRMHLFVFLSMYFLTYLFPITLNVYLFLLS
jgi:hypothetical protein